MEKNHKPFKVGISTGFWGIGKDPALLGLATKIGGLGATAGIQFVQIDLETVAEFREPGVEEQVKRMMSKLGITDVGLHGEIGEHMSVDCAEKRIWDQTHDRLVQAVRFAADLKFKYVNIHFSFRPVLSLGAEAQQRSMGYLYPIVAPDGKPLQTWVKGNPLTEKEAIKHMPIRSQVIAETETWDEEVAKYVNEQIKENLQRNVDEEIRRQLRQYPEEQRAQVEKQIDRKQVEKYVENEMRKELPYRARQDPKFILRAWFALKNTEFEQLLLSDGELGAFALVAHWMKEKGDYLWKTIAENKNPEDLYLENEPAYCAAVASKYLEGHVTVKNNFINKRYLDGMSIKEWCEAKKLYLLFENPEANRGHEGQNRLFHPQHYYHTIKNLKSPYVKICLDVEHMVSHALDPDKELKKLPNDFGKEMVLWHLGQPVPYGGTSHIPIPRGSIAQEQIYKWIYWIKKKGFKEGYILFERGGGRSGSGRQNYEVFEDSVLALKQIAEFLEKDVEPNQLPPEFFGISADNKAVWARQVVTIKEHAWDPLDGLLSIPEEKHTFLGRVAVEKGKAQEWEKRKFR